MSDSAPLARVRASGSPLWEAVRDDLRARVLRGEFADVFPGEIALSAEYGVSRGTIRAALRPLRESGVVSARRGQQPRIVIDQTQGAFGPVYSLFEAVTAAGFSQRSRVIAHGVTRDAEAASRLGLAADAALFELARVRFADESPLAVDQIWLPEETGRALLDVDFTETALYKELAERSGITLDGGTEELRAESANTALAQLLDCEPGTTLFRIERTGWSGGTAIEFRRTCVIADRYVVRTEFGQPRTDRAAAPGAKKPRQLARANRGFVHPPGLEPGAH